MAPRQLLRLYETRKSQSFDDQKPPEQIALSESASQTHQDFLEYMLSQIRQIIGTNKWYDPVPISISQLFASQHAFPAQCLSADRVGDCIYSREAPVGGIIQVTKCDLYDYRTLPAIGIIVSKASSTSCVVQYGGVLSGVYGGLERPLPVFLDYDGGLTHVVPTPDTGRPAWLQHMGAAIGESIIALTPSPQLTKLVRHD